MKKLFLIRHAKSSWDDTAVPDKDRPLNARGKRDAATMGERLAKRDVKPDLIMSSPAKRALTSDPEGVSFWKIKHGIRLTGMPSFGYSLSDQKIWTLALFLKHMDKLPPAVQQTWQQVQNWPVTSVNQAGQR